MSFDNSIENIIKKYNENIKINNILHIGACLGEEITFYETLNPKLIYWFEPNPKLLEKLRQNVSKNTFISEVFSYAVSSKKGVANFNIIENQDQTNPGCSSLQELKIHADLYKNIKKVNTCEVQTINIDEFLTENNLETKFNLVSLDTQGHDFEILNSSSVIFESELIVIETADVELYEGQKVSSEIETLLNNKGYRKEYYHPFHQVWGDTLFVKN